VKHVFLVTFKPRYDVFLFVLIEADDALFIWLSLVKQRRKLNPGKTIYHVYAHSSLASSF